MELDDPNRGKRLQDREGGDAALQAVQVALEAAQTELVHVISKLSGLAVTDGLTGLKSRRVFQERLVEEVARASRYGAQLSLLLLDVDEFAKYNYDAGHITGDDILRRIAEALRQHARETDIIARIGGDEFALILPNTGATGAMLSAERLGANIKATEWPGPATTVSFGAATLNPQAQVEGSVSGGSATPPAPLHQDRAAELLKAAEIALLQSKVAGRNRATHADDLKG
ncbi:MAG: GGDEF domain-containing protein [Armatimonadota bacterium]|nr:GGDEF domain-containing protein [Armatimonadota bacterium]